MKCVGEWNKVLNNLKVTASNGQVVSFTNLQQGETCGQKTDKNITW